MYKTLLEGLLLGFSTGSLCLLTCTPIYLPYLISEDRKLSKGILAVLEISAGRFFSYLAFGAIAGYTVAQAAIAYSFIAQVGIYINQGTGQVVWKLSDLLW